MFGRRIGIDLGTSSVMIYRKGKGIVLKEPSVVAVERSSGRILKVGQEALELLGRAPDKIQTVRPLRDGAISDYEITEKMLRRFIRKANGRSLFRPRAVISVPSRINEVEERAVRDVMLNAGVRSVELVEKPMAAALGAGEDISGPKGVMVLDIGSGTADAAVMSLNDVVVSDSIKCAGDRFDDAIIRYVRKEQNAVIGQRTAEEIKIRIGCLSPRPEKLVMTVRGRNAATGLPREFDISSAETMAALMEPARQIAEMVQGVLSRTPPELVSDVASAGILLTGGGALVFGLDAMLATRVGIRMRVCPNARDCVAKGAGLL